MKINELNLENDYLLKTVSNDTQSSSIFYVPIAGETTPVINVIRCIGAFVSHRVHYIKGLIDDSEIPSCVPCTGATCPLCIFVKKLYNLNVPEAIEKARSIKSVERTIWNVIPIGTKDTNLIPYQWDGAPRVLIWSFGVTVKKQIIELVNEYGHPGALNSYLLSLAVTKDTRGLKITVSPHKTKQKTQTGIVETIVSHNLTPEQLEMEVNNLDDFFKTDPQVINKIRNSLDIKIEEKSNKKDVEEMPFCYGDKEFFGAESVMCSMCEFMEACRTELEGKI